MADDIWPRFDGAGFAEVLAHATPPATPLRCASVGRFSFGEIGPPLPVTDSLPFSTSTEGPSSPFVTSALTVPPGPAPGPTGACAGLLPSPPPQPAANTSARASVAI